MKLGQKIAINYIRAKLNMMAVFSTKLAARKAFVIFCSPLRKSKKQLPVIFDSAEKITIVVQGNQVRGFRWNKGGFKRVLILHGFESSVKNFDAYITPLIAKDYEVLAFDAPAHGESSGKQITLPLYIETIRSIYFETGTVHSFIAHSFGAMALALFIEKIPHDEQVKLVLIAPLIETSTAIDSFCNFLQLGDNVKMEFEKIIQDKGGRPISYYSLPRVLEHIKASILWVHDKDDDVIPFMDAEPVIKKHYPNLRFYITSGLGHRKIYRDSKVVSDVTDFL